MINKFNAKILTISGVVYLILGVIIVNVITGTYAYTDTCPDGYTDPDKDGICSREPEYSCPNGGTYDTSRGMCVLTDSCPSGYTLEDDNFCTKSDTCPNGGNYDSSLGKCIKTQECPSGYTLTDDNFCTSNVCPNGGNYDSSLGKCIKTQECPGIMWIEDDNVCVSGSLREELVTPEGFEIYNSTTNSMIYTSNACGTGGVYNSTTGQCTLNLSTPSGYSILRQDGNTMIYMATVCNGGVYNSTIGQCTLNLSTPSGYRIFDQSGNTMIYGAEPSGSSCPNGGTLNGDGDCVYQLTPDNSDSDTGNENAGNTGNGNTGGDNTGGDNTGGSGNGNTGTDGGNTGGGSTETKEYQVTFESLDEEYLENPVLLENDAIMTDYVISNITSTSFDLSIYSALSDNYDFVHWSSSENCDDANSVLSGNITLTGDNTTVYACWKEKTNTGGEEEVKKYDVTFNVGDGALYVDNNKTTSLTYKLSEIDLSKYVAKKDKYTFVGWSTSENNCTTAVTSGVRNLTNDTKLYACYKEVVEEKIENPKTGKGALYLVFVLGGLSLAVIAYCSRKFIKE